MKKSEKRFVVHLFMVCFWTFIGSFLGLMLPLPRAIGLGIAILALATLAVERKRIFQLVANFFAPFRVGECLVTNEHHPDQATVDFIVRVSQLTNAGPDRQLVVDKSGWVGGCRGGYAVWFKGSEDFMTPASWFRLKEDDE